MWALLLWIVGVEIGPGLHIALHGRLAPHVHGVADAKRGSGHEHRHGRHHEHRADGVGHGGAHHVASHADGHEHHAHHHHHADDGSGDASAQHATDGRAQVGRLDPEHGAHDLMHRQLALAIPPPVLPEVVFAAIARAPELGRIDDHVAARPAPRLRARGPPRASGHAVDCSA